jgi:hypothetical protein
MRQHHISADLWVQPEEALELDLESEEEAAATCTAGQTFVGCLGGTIGGYIALLLSCSLGIIVCIVVRAMPIFVFKCIVF